MNWKLIEVFYFYKINGYYYLLIVEGGMKYEYVVIIVWLKKIEGLYEVYLENLLIIFWLYFELFL